MNINISICDCIAIEVFNMANNLTLINIYDLISFNEPNNDDKCILSV